MKRIMIVPALLALCAQPAFAGDWNEYYSYESYSYEAAPGGDGGYVTYDTLPDSRAPYVSDGYVMTYDEPSSYDTSCEVEREWEDGHYRETVECDED